MMLSVVWLSVVVRVICRWLRDIVMSVGCGFMKMKVYSLLRRLMMREVIWNVVVVVVSWMGSLRFRRAFLVAWGRSCGNRRECWRGFGLGELHEHDGGWVWSNLVKKVLWLSIMSSIRCLVVTVVKRLFDVMMRAPGWE